MAKWELKGEKQQQTNSTAKTIRKKSEINQMKKSLKIAIGAALLCSIPALSVWAHSISYITTSGSFNQAVTVAPNGHDATLDSDVCPGAQITFNVTFGISPIGSDSHNPTGFPRSVSFGATDGASNPTSLL